jgi:hypothetical protein
VIWPSARNNGRTGRRAAVFRTGSLAITISLCLAGSVKLFASASTAAGGGHVDSVGRSGDAKLIPSARRRAQQVAGQSVTAVGDSVMVESTPALQHALPGIYIDAVVGRQFSTGLRVIADLKATGLLRPIVVVGLGTNGTVTAAEIGQLFAELGPTRKLVLLNTFEARPWEQEVNATLAAAASSHPGVVLADWYTTIEHRTNLLWPDGIHPHPRGGLLYAQMLKAALERLVNTPAERRLDGVPG